MRLEGTGWAWGVMKPHGAVVSQRHGDDLRHGSVPVQPTPAAERGQGAGCHALPCSTVLSLGSLMAPPGPRLDSALCFWGGGLQAKGHSGCTPLPPPAQTHPSQDMRQLERWIWGLEVVQ